ncbi:MAG: hypothetical protein ABIO99_00425 [Candidatus Limnocylindria bacterium]
MTAGIMVAGFVAGTILLLVLNYELTGARPAPTGEFTQDILGAFEWDAARWPLDFADGVLFAAGFAALGLLGSLLARIVDPSDSRRSIIVGTFLLAGGLGVAAQLVWIGAKPVATSPQYCDCGLLAEEIMARLMGLNIVSGVQTWLTNGAAIAAAVGLVVAARPGVRAGMPRGWAMVTYATVLATVILVALSAFRADPFDLIGTALVAAVLLPVWAIWLAQRAEGLHLAEAAVE